MSWNTAGTSSSGRAFFPLRADLLGIDDPFAWREVARAPAISAVTRGVGATDGVWVFVVWILVGCKDSAQCSWRTCARLECSIAAARPGVVVIVTVHAFRRLMTQHTRSALSRVGRLAFPLTTLSVLYLQFRQSAQHSFCRWHGWRSLTLNVWSWS
jgi:hypothetical protein